MRETQVHRNKQQQQRRLPHLLSATCLQAVLPGSSLTTATATAAWSDDMDKDLSVFGAASPPLAFLLPFWDVAAVLLRNQFTRIGNPILIN